MHLTQSTLVGTWDATLTSLHWRTPITALPAPRFLAFSRQTRYVLRNDNTLALAVNIKDVGQIVVHGTWAFDGQTITKTVHHPELIPEPQHQENNSPDDQPATTAIADTDSLFVKIFGGKTETAQLNAHPNGDIIETYHAGPFRHTFRWQRQSDADPDQTLRPTTTTSPLTGGKPHLAPTP